MTKVQLGEFFATLNGTAWTCDSAPVREMLQLHTDAVEISASVPDIEQHIVAELRLLFPMINVIEQPSPTDVDPPEGLLM